MAETASLARILSEIEKDNLPKAHKIMADALDGLEPSDIQFKAALATYAYHGKLSQTETNRLSIRLNIADILSDGDSEKRKEFVKLSMPEIVPIQALKS